MASNYVWASLSAKTNEIVCYKPISFNWVKQFRNRILSAKEAPHVELYVAQEDYKSSHSFGVSKGDTLLKTGHTGKMIQVSRPWGEEKTGTLPLRKLKLKSRLEWSCEDVCEYVVKPQCKEIVSYYTDVLAKDNPALVRQKDFDRGVFVSYARKTTFDELLNALDNYFENEPSIDRENAYIWLDIFCANQPKLTDPMSGEDLTKLRYGLLTKGLHHAISKFDGKVIVFDDWKNPTPLQRAWCIWEIFGVAVVGQDLDIAMTPQQEDEFVSALQKQAEFGDIMNSLARIDVQRADCFNSEDLKMIQDTIREQSSFAEVNETVLKKLREWHIKVAERERKKRKKDDTAKALLLNNFGMLLQEQGKYDEAKPLYEKSLCIMKELLGNEHADVARILNNLAGLLSFQGEYDEALQLHYEALEIREKVLGKEHPSYALQLNNIAESLNKQGKYDKALKLSYEALTIREKVLGKEHPSYALQLNNIAELLQAQRKFAEAEALFRQALSISKRIYGAEHPKYALQLNNLGLCLKAQGKLDEVEAMYRRALAIRRKVLGNEHPDVAQSLNNLVQLLRAKGNLNEAESLMREAVGISGKVYGKEHPNYALKLNNLGSLLKAQGNLDEAKKTYEKSMAIRRKALGNEHPDVAQSLNNIALLLGVQGKHDEALKLLYKALSIRKKALGKDHPDVAQTLNSIAVLLWTQDKNSKDAERLGREALRIAEKSLGNEHPKTRKYREDWG